MSAASAAVGIGPWRATFGGLCAALVGIGLSRFAYTPLIPALIEAGWFTPGQAAYLGAANLAGYLAGALLARPLAARASTATLLRAMMLLSTVVFFACAFPLSFAWFFVWRVVSGVTGGVLMVLAAPAVLPLVPPARRGLAGGVIFTGVGLGIAASGTLVPVLLDWGLAETWLGLGALALVLTLASWSGWPSNGLRASPAISAPSKPAAGGGPWTPGALKALYLEYGLNAVALVPHMVFLVDFVARGLDQGIASGARYWVLFGLGAMAGPVLAGRLADRIGFGPTLRLAFLAQAGVLIMLATTASPLWLIASSVVIGALVPGVVPLVLGRAQDLLAHDRERHTAAWSRATVAFALGQAGAAYAFSFLFERTGDYLLLFALGAAALGLALAIDLAAGLIGRRQ
ncbi:MAG: YbfB/YjiJ family MFS transporter [Kiloniellales bacterium]